VPESVAEYRAAGERQADRVEVAFLVDLDALARAARPAHVRVVARRGGAPTGRGHLRRASAGAATRRMGPASMTLTTQKVENRNRKDIVSSQATPRQAVIDRFTGGTLRTAQEIHMGSRASRTKARHGTPITRRLGVRIVHSNNLRQLMPIRIPSPFVAIGLLTWPLVAQAQSAADVSAVRAIPQAFADAWGKGDAHQLSNLMSADVDFVTVGATWLHGRSDFETYHGRLLGGRFKGSVNTPLAVKERCLNGELCLLHWSWRLEGDRNADGSARPPRVGLMTMVVEKRAGAWTVVSAQNTNALPGRSPEMAGLTFPIDLSGKP
jgi:uncharacterized protein (TIGR02246 family)